MVKHIIVVPHSEGSEEKKVEYRMSEKQLKTARSLIREICCNYDNSTGGCLSLDRGEVVQCPQMISQSVICKWFRDAVLEDKRAKELKTEIYGLDHRKVCAVCGGHFQAISNRAKYCSKCAKEQQRKRNRENMRKNRG